MNISPSIRPILSELTRTGALSKPVWDGYLADPFVLRCDEPDGPVFYAIGTGAATVDGETSESAVQDSPRHFPILRSRDLQNWEHLGSALNPVPGLENAEHWAPEFCEQGGKFWMFYSVDCQGASGNLTQRLRLATAPRPEGPFDDSGILLFPDAPFGDGDFCIDASPFRDPQSGEWFLFFSRDNLNGERPGTGTYVVQLDAEMRPQGEIHPVVLPGYDWQIFERERPLYNRTFAAWHTVEGAQPVFRHGLYWCFYSAGNWQNVSYGVSYAVAEHPLGPWQDMGGDGGERLLQTGLAGLRGPGHNSLVVGPDGRDYLVFHAWNEEGTQRQMHISPLEWA